MTKEFGPVKMSHQNLMMMRSQNDPNVLSSWLRTILKPILLSLMLCFLCLWSAPLGLAEDSVSTDSVTDVTISESKIAVPSFDANSIPSEKVSQFVEAYLQVLELIDRRQGELLGAETKLASQRLEREIEAQALLAIEQAGLTQQEYLQLLSLANMDPAFSERIAASLEEARN